MLEYQRVGFRGRTELRWLAPAFADDANQIRSPTTLVLGAALGYGRQIGAWELRFCFRGSNLLNWKYADNLRVNGRASRFFEPAPGPTVLGTFELAGLEGPTTPATGQAP
jgi:outer membrane receptor protein involved in Fe transport